MGFAGRNRSIKRDVPRLWANTCALCVGGVFFVRYLRYRCVRPVSPVGFKNDVARKSTPRTKMTRDYFTTVVISGTTRSPFYSIKTSSQRMRAHRDLLARMKHSTRLRRFPRVTFQQTAQTLTTHNRVLGNVVIDLRRRSPTDQLIAQT